MPKKIFGIKVKEFLNLSHQAQDSWIKKNIPGFEEHCYGKGYLGAFYPGDIELAEYLSNRNSHGVSSLISKQDPEIDKERIKKIDNGAELTKAETYLLCKGIAEQNLFGWLTHNCFEVSFLDGRIFLYFQGESISTANFYFKYTKPFKTYKAVLEYISELPFSYIE